MGLAIRACQAGHPVLFATAADRVAHLADAHHAGQLQAEPTHPDWYHNLVAHPDVTAEIDTQTRRFRARTATGDEREPIWSKQTRNLPGFAGYEARTDGQIPVVILEPV
jgi:deazaflavin-dependent oxidoreductase (nitroreductase family)